MTEKNALEEIEKIREEKKTTNGMLGLQQQRIKELQEELKDLKDRFMRFPRDTAGQLIQKVKRGEMEHKSGDCQKIVDETELETYIQKGWKRLESEDQA